jgi:3-phytase
MNKTITLIALITLFMCFSTGLGAEKSTASTQPANTENESTPLAKLDAVWHTKSYLPEEQWNLDSIAFWRNPDGQDMLFVTAKEGNQIIVLDPYTGEEIDRWGETGSGLGQFSRPNGVLVVFDMLFVVERNNRRVQVLQLPSGKSIDAFGTDELIKPYGIALGKLISSSSTSSFGQAGKHTFEIYITDAYQPDTDEYLDVDDIPLSALRDIAGARVKVYNATASFSGDGSMKTFEALPSPIGNIGPTNGDGVLYSVESLVFDEWNSQQLYICDERRDDVKVFHRKEALSGNQVTIQYDRHLTSESFENDPEGIALWDIEGESGCIVVTEQAKTLTTFHFWERGSSNQYLGHALGLLPESSNSATTTATSTGPRYLASTDGICLISGDVSADDSDNPTFPGGALFAIHDDASVAAFALKDVAEALSND